MLGISWLVLQFCCAVHRLSLIMQQRNAQKRGVPFSLRNMRGVLQLLTVLLIFQVDDFWVRGVRSYATVSEVRGGCVASQTYANVVSLQIHGFFPVEFGSLSITVESVNYKQLIVEKVSLISHRIIIISYLKRLRKTKTDRKRKISKLFK